MRNLFSLPREIGLGIDGPFMYLRRMSSSATVTAMPISTYRRRSRWFRQKAIIEWITSTRRLFHKRDKETFPTLRDCGQKRPNEPGYEAYRYSSGPHLVAGRVGGERERGWFSTSNHIKLCSRPSCLAFVVTYRRYDYDFRPPEHASRWYVFSPNGQRCWNYGNQMFGARV